MCQAGFNESGRSRFAAHGRPRHHTPAFFAGDRACVPEPVRRRAAAAVAAVQFPLYLMPTLLEPIYRRLRPR
jgi:hypothetical protein